MCVIFVCRFVGAPRPNYYALQAFTSVFETDRAGIKSNMHYSFPSGHSTSTMSAFGYVCLLWMWDAKWMSPFITR